MLNPRQWGYFIAAVVLGAAGLWTLIEGLLKHWAGATYAPFLHYLIAFLLIGLAKVFKHSICHEHKK